MTSIEHWFGNKQVRLLHWRNWRLELSTMNAEERLKSIAQWWFYVPLVTSLIDPWDDSNWPTPWELVGKGQFCENAQGLGIFYTMILQELPCMLIHCQTEKDTSLVVRSESNKLLNYYSGELVDVCDATFQTLKIWAPSDLARLVKV
jgi:hypothetical protein